MMFTMIILRTALLLFLLPIADEEMNKLLCIEIKTTKSFIPFYNFLIKESGIISGFDNIQV